MILTSSPCLSLKYSSGTASICKWIGLPDHSMITWMLSVGLLILTTGAYLLSFLNYIDHIWGSHTMECFANFNNHKLTRFYSRYWNPDAESVDAFCHDWAGENNWLVPPVFLVPRVIRHLAECQSEVTLIVPEWVLSPFWPMFFGPQSLYSSFVKSTIIFSDVSGVFSSNRAF